MEMAKSPPTLKRDSMGVMKTNSSGKTDFNNSHKEESNNILQKVKPEPVDYEDTPWTGPTNTSFSAVMSSYQYLVRIFFETVKGLSLSSCSVRI